MTFVPGKAFIEGLAAVNAATGAKTHFFHTSGAKLFSSLTGVDGTISTSDAGDVYDLQREQKTLVPELQAVRFASFPSSIPSRRRFLNNLLLWSGCRSYR